MLKPLVQHQQTVNQSLCLMYCSWCLGRKSLNKKSEHIKTTDPKSGQNPGHSAQPCIFLDKQVTFLTSSSLKGGLESTGKSGKETRSAQSTLAKGLKKKKKQALLHCAARFAWRILDKNTPTFPLEDQQNISQEEDYYSTIKPSRKSEKKT